MTRKERNAAIGTLGQRLRARYPDACVSISDTVVSLEVTVSKYTAHGSSDGVLVERRWDDVQTSDDLVAIEAHVMKLIEAVR